MHYVIVMDYEDYYEGSVDILGVAHSLEEAKEIFKNYLPIVKRFANQKGFAIIEETDSCFIAECEEEWTGNYTKLYIQKV